MACTAGRMPAPFPSHRGGWTGHLSLPLPAHQPGWLSVRLFWAVCLSVWVSVRPSVLALLRLVGWLAAVLLLVRCRVCRFLCAAGMYNYYNGAPLTAHRYMDGQTPMAGWMDGCAHTHTGTWHLSVSHTCWLSFVPSMHVLADVCRGHSVDREGSETERSRPVVPLLPRTFSRCVKGNVLADVPTTTGGVRGVEITDSIVP